MAFDRDYTSQAIEFATWRSNFVQLKTKQNKTKYTRLRLKTCMALRDYWEGKTTRQDSEQDQAEIGSVAKGNWGYIH